jgi:hypothetical protein
MKKLTLSVAAIAGLSMACHAQAGDYLYSGSETTITLNPGTYDIAAYGAQGGFGYTRAGGLGAEMEAQFSFAAAVNLTILVGGGGGSGNNSGGGGGGYGGGGGGTQYNGGGGGGGSLIDTSAIMELADISGVASPDDSPDGEIMITAVPEPSSLTMAGVGIGSMLVSGFRRMIRRR